MRRLPRLAAVVLPLAVLLLSAPTADAYTVVTTSGSPGNYTETDTSASPGAQCYYHSATAADQDLSKIKILAPEVFARDSTSSRDHQTVGWQFIIQHGTTVGSVPAAWTNSYTSPIVKAKAYDNQAAPFTKRTWTATKNINRWWRVQMLLYWYKPGSTTMVSGKVQLRLGYYKIIYPPNPDTWNPNDCIPGE